MILGFTKLAIIGVVLRYTLFELLMESPITIRVQWPTHVWPYAILRAAGACLETVLGLIFLSNLWQFGSKKVSGGRVYRLQHKKAFLYAGAQHVFLMLLPLHSNRTRLMNLIVGMLLVLWAADGLLGRSDEEDGPSVYGLQHGRLHLDAHVPMWMNMGYWKVDKNNASRSKSMAEACRDLLKLVLAEAGLTKDSKQDLPRLLIDVGFGCGEQTIHLMSDKPIRQCDELWWDAEDHQVYFNQYIGITQDKSQYQYAQDRVDEFICSSIAARVGKTSLFCADAASPTKWNEDLLAALNKAKSESLETWLLALDSAYHFSPSRWVFIEQAYREFGASFMAFDLCLSPNATTLQKLILRVLTTLMGAPCANFVTPELYRQQLRQTGYNDDFIKIIDISEHVFEPLAGYLDKQDYQLKTLGLGLGRFKAAKSLFRWWGSTGVVRGVVVIAKHHGHHQ